jgi:hypothetical protein
MKVKIEANHPIATSKGFEPWDGKEHEIDDFDMLDVARAGKWLTGKVGIVFDYGAGRSRMIENVPHFFPKKRVVGVHCMRIVKIEE